MHGKTEDDAAETTTISQSPSADALPAADAAIDPGAAPTASGAVASGGGGGGEQAWFRTPF